MSLDSKNNVFFSVLVISILVLTSQALANLPPEVNNVTASQRTDGSKLVDIYYDFNDADGDLCTVSVKVSDDGGLSWDVNAVSFSGDIGSGIAPGTGKHIIWDCGTDLPGEYGTNYRVKVIADDNYGPAGMVWVYIDDPGVSGHEPFNGYMSKYETTNAQYCQFLNAALASGDITVSGNYVYGADGSNSGTDFVGQMYYNLAGSGHTYNGATNGGAARINYSGGVFTIDSGFDNHPVTYVSWYGSTAFASYYGWRLPTEWEWQAVADYDGSYTYGCGTSINNSIANYRGSTHPDGTTVVGSFGTYGYGMCDMAGNVWEWSSTVSGSYRVLRGGSWDVDGDGCVVSSWFNYYPDSSLSTIGFRVCRDLDSWADSESFTLANRDVWYVDNDAPNDPCHGNPDYSDLLEDGSPEHPFDCIQEAIGECDDGDTVIVLTGTFTGTGNRDIDFGGLAITVRSTDPNDPDVVAATIIDCQGTEADPHRGFIFENEEEADSILSGLTIINGYESDGGGIYCDGTNPTITNCTFIGNSADYGGGGMYNEDSSPTLTNCTFRGNLADAGGGGMANYGDSEPILTNCDFSGNSAEHDGGAIYNNEDSSPTLTNCTFSDNVAQDGGGMFNTEGSSPTLTNCTFSGNYAEEGGGGMFNDGVNPTLIDCTFSGNYADNYGGGMSNENSGPTLTNCTFRGNLADDGDGTGGGMFNSFDSNPVLINCTFSGNSAEHDGGAIYNDGGSLTLMNCTFGGNVATNGNAVACDHGPSNIEITNCIIWDGTSEVWNNDGSTITISYSDIQGGWFNGMGNIDADPCFVNPDSNDYHLRPGSPCIDAGDPNYVAGPNETDLDGNPRIVDGNNDGNSVVDMGAYEYNPFVLSFVVDNRERRSRTIFRYTCRVMMDNLSPGAVENVQLELVGVPDNITIIDPCVTFAHIEAWGSATSEDTCTFDVNRIEPIRPAEISWRATFEIAGTGEEMQQMSSTVVLLEPVGLASGDITGEGVVDIDDLVRMADDWLGSGSLADIYPAPPYGDDIVNFQDFAVLADNWLAGK